MSENEIVNEVTPEVRDCGIFMNGFLSNELISPDRYYLDNLKQKILEAIHWNFEELKVVCVCNLEYNEQKQVNIDLWVQGKNEREEDERKFVLFNYTIVPKE